ncbi:DUF1194 domain-containing protein [Paracraurococcus ruber]|uniref:DUF1194 domain-containing protein n=1 Tax=Paracraurococcus ruber TaxID=77675 RepID=A0ABS1D569_9PROT|nr:DUF1194 domain-containing protein [Paracraurococcus ruber]MBK1661615.1 hypothetical protein [Paracraurococcus ruber]TDG06088.1 DUF1194 domain-containing protein [Paracraurococcus ruber]
MQRRILLGAALGLGAAALGGARPGRAAGDPVDLLLVLAVDVSRSVDEDEAVLQRQGYQAGLTDPEVLAAIAGGMIGAIGVAYVEWSGAEFQQLVVPWTRIASRADAEAWAAALGRAPRASYGWTSISAALDYSCQLLAAAPWEAVRRVIDISGDGVNNSGPPVEEARDRAVAAGITINGLPILNDRPTFGQLVPQPLDAYFRESVIGGNGAFLIAVEDFASFATALRRKLILEIAGLPAAAGAG